MHCDSKRRQKSLELYGWNGLKSQKFIAQGNGYKQHALKGQKLLAQGSALGIVTVSNAPCKGKSFINFRVSFKAFALTGRQVCEHDNPGRCPGLRASAPSGRVEIIYETSIRNIPFGKHIVRQSFQLGERHVLHGMLYLANQLVSLVIVIIAQA